MQAIWQKLPRSERITIGRFQCDVWATGDGARYTVFDLQTSCYVKGGKCASVEWAKEVSTNLARSLSELS